MCYAAYSKGSTALIASVLGLAEALKVREELESEWSENGDDFVQKAHGRSRRVTAKAWRFSGEMREIASTFQAAGFPDGFHQAASEIYERLSAFKSRDETPGLEEVLQAMCRVQDQDKARPSTG